jgi:hypothetical protein
MVSGSPDDGARWRRRAQVEREGVAAELGEVLVGVEAEEDRVEHGPGGYRSIEDGGGGEALG